MEATTAWGDRPVILLGTHRSGTSVTAQILNRMGVHLGRRVDGHGESRFFQRLNQQMLLGAGATWHTPEPFLHAAKDTTFAAWAEALAKSWLMSPHFRLNYSPRPVLGVAKHPPLWGWKDPRTVITGPIWRRLYPESRLLRIRRDGREVARSLNTRQTRLAQTEPVPLRLRDLLRRRHHAINDALAPRLHDLDECIALWDDYERACDRLFDEHDGATLELEYSDLTNEPTKQAARIARWLSLDMDESDLENVVSDVRQHRVPTDQLALSPASLERLNRRGYS